MNIKLNNETENEVEFVENEDYSPKNRYKKYKMLMLIGCILLAFVVWCYANYLDDPIIKKSVDIEVSGEVISDNIDYVVIDTKSGKEINKVEIYGEKSALISVNTIEIILDESQFTDGKTSITVQLPLEDGVHSHTSEITIKKK